MNKKKTNIRSFRFTDEVLQIIESVDGENFSAKFENLVLTCYGRLDEVQDQYEYFRKMRDEVRNEYWQVSSEIANQRRRLSALVIELDKIQGIIDDVSRSVHGCASDQAAPDDNMCDE